MELESLCMPLSEIGYSGRSEPGLCKTQRAGTDAHDVWLFQKHGIVVAPHVKLEIPEQQEECSDGGSKADFERCARLNDGGEAHRA